MTTTRTRLALLAATLTLAACDGAGSGSAPGPGTGGASTAKGVITSTAGGVTVNGILFQAASAAITVEDSPGASSDLAPGMVARVRGAFDDRTGTAVEIEVEDDLAGKVTGRDGDVLRVGGHAVEVDASTEFGGGASGLDDLGPDDRVSVFGHGRASGGTRATRIERRSGSSDDFEIKGFVSGLALGPPVSFTLKVTPDASSGYAVTLAAGLALPAGVADGAFVEVRAAAPPAGGALVAVAIELEDASLGADGDEVEVEGLVASGDSASFVVEGQTVVTGGSTRWENGVPADLVPGVKVEAEGRLQGGVLAAREVSFRANVRLQGDIVGFDATDPAHPTFRVNGLTVRLDAFTEVEEDSGDPVDLATRTGPVEVRGYPHRGGTDVVATRVRAESDERVIVQGPVSASDGTAGTLTILGVIVRIGAGTELRDVHDAPMSRDAFFAAVGAGPTVVKARGEGPAALSGGVLDAEQAEIEGSR
jgi:hypothetical protein